MKLRPLFALALLVLGGCPIVPRTPATSANVLGPAASAANEVKAKVSAAEVVAGAARARVAANLINAQKANAGNAEGPSKATVDDEVGLGLKNNGNVQPDPTELLAGEQRLRLRAEGREKEALKLSQESALKAEEAILAKTIADAVRDTAIAEQGQVLEAAQKLIEASNLKHASEQSELDRRHKAELASLQAKIDAKDLSFLTYVLGGIGGLCILGAIGIAVASFYSPLGFNPHNIGIAALLVVSAFGCFGLVRFLSHPWIPHVVGGVCLACIVVAFVLWFQNWRKHNQLVDTERKAAQATEDKLGTVTATAANIVDQLEITSKKFPDAAKELFLSLKDAMDGPQKDTVKWLKTLRPSKT